jgi:hypothetical protein
VKEKEKTGKAQEWDHKEKNHQALVIREMETKVLEWVEAEAVLLVKDREVKVVLLLKAQEDKVQGRDQPLETEVAVEEISLITRNLRKMRRMKKNP